MNSNLKILENILLFFLTPGVLVGSQVYLLDQKFIIALSIFVKFKI